MIRLTVAFLALTLPAVAEDMPSNCADRSSVVGAISGNISEGSYAEQQAAIWIDPDSGAMMEIYANHATGTASVIRTLPGGPTCLVGAGVYFRAFDLASQGDPT